MTLLAVFPDATFFSVERLVRLQPAVTVTHGNSRHYSVWLLRHDLAEQGQFASCSWRGLSYARWLSQDRCDSEARHSLGIAAAEPVHHCFHISHSLPEALRSQSMVAASACMCGSFALRRAGAASSSSCWGLESHELCGDCSVCSALAQPFAASKPSNVGG